MKIHDFGVGRILHHYQVNLGIQYFHMVLLKQVGSNFVVNYCLRILRGFLQIPCSLKADLELNQNNHSQVQNPKDILIQKLKV